MTVDDLRMLLAQKPPNAIVLMRVPSQIDGSATVLHTVDVVYTLATNLVRDRVITRDIVDYVELRP